MPKVRGSLADVSTEFQPVEPDTYVLELKECKEVVHDDDRVHYEVLSEIKGLYDGGAETPSDFDGRKIRDFIHIHTKDGELNEYGLINLKRYAEATVGEERANDEDFDTDEMLNSQFVAEVYIDEYQGRKNNKIKNIVAYE